MIKKEEVQRPKNLSKCPFCKGRIMEKYTELKDRLETTKETFSVYECTVCAAGVLNPMPPGDFSRFYPTNYLSGETQIPDPQGSKFDLEKWYRYNQYQYDFDLLKRASGLDIQNVASYIDIGCGSGERVTFAREQGNNKSFGVDKFDFAKNKSRREDNIINSEITNFNPKEKFQVASLFHVLEHLDNPQEVLAHIRENVLSKNGHLIIQVPNYGSYERGVFKNKWFGLDAPRHLWHFNEKALIKTLEEAGYEVEGSYQLNAPLHPVTIVPSLFRDLDIQRIWVIRRHETYKTIMKIIWAGLTILTVPVTIVQNIFNGSSMLTVVAKNK